MYQTLLTYYLKSMKTKDNARFNIVLVTGVVEKEERYLIAQRSYDEIQAPGKWALPGGKVEVNDVDFDVIEKTLLKEIEEEVGIIIHSNPIYVKSSSFVRVDKSPVVNILFLCKWRSGEAKPLEDTIDIAWIKLSDAKNYDFCTGIYRALKLASKRSFYNKG